MNFILLPINKSTVGAFILAFGLFGFAGGVTNWLAVKMLFDKLPYVYGSGVIPERFMEIRKAIKKMLMTAFSEESFLKEQLETQMPKWLEGFNIESKLDSFLSSPKFDTVLKASVEE